MSVFGKVSVGFLALVACGCGGSHSIVGEWEGIMAVPHNGIAAKCRFNDDQTFWMQVDMAGMSGKVGGKYQFGGDQLSLNSNQDAIEYKGLDPHLKKLFVEQVKMATASRKGKVTWRKDNQFILVSEEGTSTFTRLNQKDPS
ncbi:MAG: hypothetical protein JSS72_05710 [Armatimonadetes bacterium]|nr:hypothetical protein [Armatimonadota bacterium]